jgi:hypothetical protein
MSRRKTERQYPLNRPPDGMVVEPDLPTNNPMSPSQLSQNNAMAASDEDYLPPVTDAAGNPLPLDDLDVGMMDEAPPEVRRAAASIPETGVLFNLEPFEQIAQLHAAGRTDEARQIYDSLDAQSKYVYQNARNMSRFTEEEGARLADEFRKNQDRLAAQEADPVRQQTVAKGQTEAAAKQFELQEHYRQEMEYQRLLQTIGDKKTNRNQRQVAMQRLEGLAASIGKRISPGGLSAAALGEAKNAVGFIPWQRELNPFGDYGPAISAMQTGSEDRIGLLRSQMEAAGVEVPSIEQAAPEPPVEETMRQTALEKHTYKRPDGSPVTIAVNQGEAPQPVVKGMADGKPVYRRVGADGMFYRLTPEQVQQLGLE